MKNIQINEFRKLLAGPDELASWVWTKKVASPLGKFSVEMQMLDEGDASPPDPEMIRRAEELVQFLETNANLVTEVVMAAHHWMAKEDPSEFEMAGVPLTVSKDEVKKYLRRRGLYVARQLTEPVQHYLSSIAVTPLWDEEHGLRMSLQDGRITQLNQCNFSISDGVLKYEFE